MQHFHRLAISLIASMAALVVSASAASTTVTDETTHGDQPVATVNDVVIPQNRLSFMLKHYELERGRGDSPDLRQEIRDTLVTHELLAQEAIKQGLDKQDDIQTRLAINKQNVLIQALFSKFQKEHPVSDSEIKQRYDKMKAQEPQQEYHVRHILLESEADANKMLGLLKKGKKFEALAKENSKDSGSKTKGGDLGWAVATNYAKPFSDTMVSLKKGEISKTPVKTEFGWHIIKVEDVRKLQGPGLEEVKPFLTQQLQYQHFQSYVDNLKANAKID